MIPKLQVLDEEKKIKGGFNKLKDNNCRKTGKLLKKLKQSAAIDIINNHKLEKLFCLFISFHRKSHITLIINEHLIFLTTEPRYNHLGI
jgi:hypothetical protein